MDKLIRRISMAIDAIKIYILIAIKIRVAADILDAGKIYRMGPKVFATLSIAVFVSTLSVSPFSGRVVGWAVPLTMMSEGDVRIFMSSFNISPVEADEYVPQELVMPGSSILSEKIKSQAGSVSESDVTLFLSKVNVVTAKEFRDKFDCASIATNGAILCFQIFVLPIWLCMQNIYGRFVRFGERSDRLKRLNLYYVGYFYMTLGFISIMFFVLRGMFGVSSLCLILLGDGIVIFNFYRYPMYLKGSFFVGWRAMVASTIMFLSYFVVSELIIFFVMYFAINFKIINYLISIFV